MDCYICGGELAQEEAHSVSYYPDALGPVDLCDGCWKMKIE